MPLQAAELPPDVEPLILWEPPENEPGAPVEVDTMLTTFLRPHQREGVQFMFECVAGLRPHSGQGMSEAARLLTNLPIALLHWPQTK